MTQQRAPHYLLQQWLVNPAESCPEGSENLRAVLADLAHLEGGGDMWGLNQDPDTHVAATGGGYAVLLDALRRLADGRRLGGPLSPDDLGAERLARTAALSGL